MQGIAGQDRLYIVKFGRGKSLLVARYLEEEHSVQQALDLAQQVMPLGKGKATLALVVLAVFCGHDLVGQVHLKTLGYRYI